MSLKSPSTPEARLQKLKDDIALRKQLRLQSQLQESQCETVEKKEEEIKDTKKKTEESVNESKTEGSAKKADTSKKAVKDAHDQQPTPKKTKKRKLSENVSCPELSFQQESMSTGDETVDAAETESESPRKVRKKKKKKQLEDSADQNESKNDGHPDILEDKDAIRSGGKKGRDSDKQADRLSECDDDETLEDGNSSSQLTSPEKTPKSKKDKKKKRLTDAETILSEMGADCQGKVPVNKKRKSRKNDWVTKEDAAKPGSDSGLEQEEEGVDDTDEETSEKEEEDMANTIGGFSVLGNFDNVTAKPVKRKLPGWLAKPSIIKGGAGLNRRQTSETDTQDGDKSVFNILDDDLKHTLQENNIRRFFPVQQQFIPELWEDVKCGLQGGRYGFRPQDICVSAPTGSGKTLAYVLPIVQSLKKRMVPKVYAVVVLPVRDLAEQVYKVFCQYCAGTEIKVGLVVGKTSLSMEKDSLVRKRHPGVYHSLVDIIVATPGRLTDHIRSTPGFDLSSLRFLVIDEADRMMEDIVKNDWLSAVEDAAYHSPPLVYFPCARTRPGPPTMFGMCTQLPLQKLLFSATLSHNPEKLEQLNLFKPQLMTSVIASSHKPLAQLSKGPGTEEGGETPLEDNTEKDTDGFVGKYTTPEGLSEYLVEGTTAEKPLLILHFLHNLKFRSILCFTNSLEATHRLCLLVKLYGDINVREFSSRLPAEKRKKILRQFSKGKIDMIVCSDSMARGMDVDNVRYVISYDNPPYIKTYIHRVGRTARAGRAGTAISLLEKKEFFHFKQMMREAGKWSGISEMKFGRHALKPLEAPFKEALAKLPEIIKEEKKKDPKQ